MNNSQRQTPPVSEGQEVDVQIESMGDKGDGVARVKGFVVFVPNVTKGEWVKIRIKKVLTNVAFADKIGEAKPGTPSEPARGRPQARPGDFADQVDLENLGEASEDF